MKVQINELKGDHLFDILGILGELEIQEDVEALLITNTENSANKKIVQLQDHKKKQPTKKEKEQAEIEKIEKEKEEAKQQARLVAKVISKLIAKAPVLKERINPLLADASSKDVSVIKELSFKEYVALLKDFVMVVKDDLQDFFSSMQSSSSNPEETESTG